MRPTSAAVNFEERIELFIIVHMFREKSAVHVNVTLYKEKSYLMNETKQWKFNVAFARVLHLKLN